MRYDIEQEITWVVREIWDMRGEIFLARGPKLFLALVSTVARKSLLNP